MPIEIVKPAQHALPCERCNATDLPVVTLQDRDEDWSLTLCPLCLGDGIETATGWRLRRTLDAWAHSSGLRNRYASPDLDDRKPGGRSRR